MKKKKKTIRLEHRVPYLAEIIPKHEVDTTSLHDNKANSTRTHVSGVLKKQKTTTTECLNPKETRKVLYFLQQKTNNPYILIIRVVETTCPRNRSQVLSRLPHISSMDDSGNTA